MTRYTPEQAEVAIRALEEIRDKSIEPGTDGWCSNCCMYNTHIPEARCGIASRALATIRERVGRGNRPPCPLCTDPAYCRASGHVNTPLCRGDRYVPIAAYRPGEAKALPAGAEEVEPGVYVMRDIKIRQDVEAHFGPLVRPGSQGEAKATGDACKYNHRPGKLCVKCGTRPSKRPTIVELEAILNDPAEHRIEVQPNGEIRAVRVEPGEADACECQHDKTYHVDLRFGCKWSMNDGVGTHFCPCVKFKRATTTPSTHPGTEPVR